MDIAAASVEGPGWLQVNCALFPQGVGSPPYVPWSDLHQALERWRGEERFRRAFFLRKPPGLRLRFWGPELHSQLQPALVAWLEEAEQRNGIRGFRFAVYEPERFRFGGQVGMAIAHDHFDLDSRLALRYETLSPSGQAGLPRDLFSLVVANDLFRQCVDDGAELWDVWQRLRQQVAAAASIPDAAQDDLRRERDALSLAAAFTQGLTPAASDLLAEARAGNERIAARLHAAAVAERLSVGTRAWLAAVCIFHWNRLGLTTDELGPMVVRMLRLLESAGDEA
jgi:thiopeptide-type bacteriocin biosynthesis protein